MTTYDTNIPGAPGYAQTALLAKKAYQEALARINAQRQGTLRNYGYRADVNPETGVLGQISVDGSNPYGQLQQTLEMNADEAQGAEDAMIDRGVKGGLANQAESKLQKVFGGRKASLGSSLLGALGGLQDQQNQSKYAFDSALTQAEIDATRNAVSDGNFNPANRSGEPQVGYGTAPAPPPADPGAGDDMVTKVSSDKVLWQGKYRTRDQLVKILIARGVKPSAWAKNHPAAASQLGISPKLNANNKLIKQIKKRG